jgi:hypothetical protein
MNSVLFYSRFVTEVYIIYMVVALLREGPRAMWKYHCFAMDKVKVLVDSILTVVVDMIVGSAEHDNHR